MFDLITGTMERPLRERAPGSAVTSIALHVVVLTLAVGIPLMSVTSTLPDTPTMMAFTAAPPAPPLPPPPPPPSPARSPEPRTTPKPEPKKPGEVAVPLEMPTELKPEATTGPASTGSGGEGVEGAWKAAS
jgi:outer membrane biosynthesis protein TonB